MEFIILVACGVVLGGLVLKGMRYVLFWKVVATTLGIYVFAVAVYNWPRQPSLSSNHAVTRHEKIDFSAVGAIPAIQ